MLEVGGRVAVGATVEVVASGVLAAAGSGSRGRNFLFLGCSTTGSSPDFWSSILTVVVGAEAAALVTAVADACCPSQLAASPGSGNG